MSPLFDENQKLDKSELLDSLAKKPPRSHKAMLITQGFNPETGDLATFVEHCERSETTYNISGAKFDASDKESNTKRKKKLSKFKERDENGKKHHKKQSSIYCSIHGENKSLTTRECRVLKSRTKDRYKPNHSTQDYNRKSREVNLLEKEASHQRAKYLKYKKLNKAFAKKKNHKEETVILDDTLDSNSSSSSKDKNSRYRLRYRSEERSR